MSSLNRLIASAMVEGGGERVLIGVRMESSVCTRWEEKGGEGGDEEVLVSSEAGCGGVGFDWSCMGRERRDRTCVSLVDRGFVDAMVGEQW